MLFKHQYLKTSIDFVKTEHNHKKLYLYSTSVLKMQLTVFRLRVMIEKKRRHFKKITDVSNLMILLVKWMLCGLWFSKASTFSTRNKGQQSLLTTALRQNYFPFFLTFYWSPWGNSGHTNVNVAAMQGSGEIYSLMSQGSNH